MLKFGNKLLRVSLLFAYAILIAVTGAGAATVPASLVCDASTKKIDKVQFLRWLIRSAGGGAISEDALDPNNDGTQTLVERISAVTDPFYCTASYEEFGRPICRGSDERFIVQLQDVLLEFLENGEEEYSFVFRDSFTQRRWANSDPHERLRLFLTSNGSVVEAQCTKPFKPLPVTTPGILAEAPKPQTGWRITDNLKHLSTSRTGKNALNAVSPARFSVLRDFKKGLTQFQANAYAGYRFEQFNEGSSLTTIPYLMIEKKFNNQNANEVDKLGAGIIAAITTGQSDEYFNEYTLAGQFVTDSKANTKIGVVKGFWRPGILSEGIPNGPFDQFVPLFGSSQFDWRILADVVGEAGHVFENGGNQALSDKGNYVRVGGEIHAKVVGSQEGMFKNTELDVNYRHLVGLIGDLDEFQRVRASLTQYFPNMEHLGFGVVYNYGHVEETLQKQHSLQGTFMIRY